MNYIELTNKGITHKYFAFIDAKEMLISQLCEDRGIHLKLIDGYDHDNYPNYSIYICKVKNSNINILKVNIITELLRNHFFVEFCLKLLDIAKYKV